MPLGLKPTCSVCKTTSSSMWKKGPQGEILCHHCTGRGGAGGGGSCPGVAGGTGGGGGGAGGGFGAATFASTSAAPPQSNGGGGGKQSKQEIHRRSARLRNTKYKSAPAAEKKVSTKGKGRRHIFKLKNPIKAPESVSTIITAESIFYKGVYYQIGDVVSVIDEQDGKPYYAQIRGFIQDQYCEKSAALTWLIPTLASPRDQFDPASYIVVTEHELRKGSFIIDSSISACYMDFPGGTVEENPPASAEDVGSIPGPGRFYMAWSQLSPRGTTSEARVPYRACAPQQETPPQREARAPQQGEGPAHHHQRKPPQSSEDPVQSKIK
ncbi:GATA zinc finger domain-containing protein 1 isoform X1 [Ovis aries]|uniref:GATA zinc finger domain containing 1 n=1 Tax=Ovis aries TaxID=9940 RepID=A0AC11BSH8_SHEEP|nr:GATA zinc finger domain-containing protein 1 isoform X1 [Ovis aries]